MKICMRCCARCVENDCLNFIVEELNLFHPLVGPGCHILGLGVGSSRATLIIEIAQTRFAKP